MGVSGTLDATALDWRRCCERGFRRQIMPGAEDRQRCCDRSLICLLREIWVLRGALFAMVATPAAPTAPAPAPVLFAAAVLTLGYIALAELSIGLRRRQAAFRDQRRRT